MTSRGLQSMGKCKITKIKIMKKKTNRKKETTPPKKNGKHRKKKQEKTKQGTLAHFFLGNNADLGFQSLQRKKNKHKKKRIQSTLAQIVSFCFLVFFVYYYHYLLVPSCIITLGLSNSIAQRAVVTSGRRKGIISLTQHETQSSPRAKV